MASFHFYRTNTPLAKTIRFVSGGECNHVSVQIGGYIYESNPIAGVTRRRADMDMRNPSVSISFGNLDEEEMTCFLEEQIGKKYDYVGALSFLWVFFRPRIGRWYCSELGMVALMKGLGMRSWEYDQKQSPQSLNYQCQIIRKIT
jgi:hypothetical protein